MAPPPVPTSELGAALEAQPPVAEAMAREGDGDEGGDTESCWETYETLPKSEMHFDVAQDKWFKDEACARSFAAKEAAQPRSSQRAPPSCCCGLLKSDFAHKVKAKVRKADGSVESVLATVYCWGGCCAPPMLPEFTFEIEQQITPPICASSASPTSTAPTWAPAHHRGIGRARGGGIGRRTSSFAHMCCWGACPDCCCFHLCCRS